MSGLILYPSRLLNPSFEHVTSGVPDDWTDESVDGAVASSSTSYHKDYSLSLAVGAGSGDTASVVQEVTESLTVGDEWTVVFWAKTSAGTPVLKVSFIEMSGTVEGTTTINTPTLTSGWVRYSFTHTITDSVTDGYMIRCENSGNSSTVLVDLVCVGKSFTFTREFSKFDVDLVTEKEVNTTSSGLMETIQEHSKDEVEFGWDVMFPAQAANTIFFWEGTRDGSPFALFFDYTDGSDEHETWPRLVHLKDAMPLERKKGVHHYGKIMFKAGEDD